MALRNAFACLDDSDEEPAPQVKSKAKTKAPAAAPAPARDNNNRRYDNRRDNRRDNRGRDNRGRDNRGRGEYNHDAADSGARKYRRDDRRQDRRRDADRRDRRRDGNNQDQRRGRNQYEKSHQKRGPKKGGHGGWGTDKDAVDVAEETAGAASPDAPTEEGATDETPSEPAAPAVQELTLEEHEAAEKERRAQFNARWASKAPAASKQDLAKEFSGMAVVSKKTRKAGADTWAAARKAPKASSKSAQKAKELKKAIFAEPTHHGGGDYGDRGRGRGGDRGGRGGGLDRPRGGRGGGRGGRDYGSSRGGRGARGGRDNRGGGGGSNRRYDVDTQDVNEFPALS